MLLCEDVLINLFIYIFYTDFDWCKLENGVSKNFLFIYLVATV